jgi:hypothetical protein
VQGRRGIDDCNSHAALGKYARSIKVPYLHGEIESLFASENACRSRHHLRPGQRPLTALGARANTDMEAGGRRLELNLFSHIQGVVHLNPEISDGAFQFRMTEQS